MKARNLTIAVMTTTAFTLTACAGTSTNQNAFDQAANPQPSASTDMSAPAPAPTEEPLGIINTINLPKKTVTVGEVILIEFTPVEGSETGSSSLIENVELLELNPEKSDPEKGTLAYTATKAGTTKVAVIGTNSKGDYVGTWEGFDLTIVD